MERKQLYELTIDPEFRDMIPPLSEEEYRMLEESIVRDGCDTPLMVWNGIIVDGHNRYTICHKHGIVFAIEEKAFEDRNAAVFWMLEHQLARRNLNSYQRSELALKLEPLYAARAKKRLATSTGGNEPRPRQNSAQAEKGKTNENLGRLAGVSRDTLAKVKELNAKADESVRNQLRKGEVSINRAYNELKNSEHQGETRICQKCGEEKAYTEFDIPSNGRAYRVVCRDCEKKAKRAQPSDDEPVLQSLSGIAVKNGKLAHVPTQLEDDPDQFGHVLSLLESATRAYIATFETAINKLQPSMMTHENTKTINRMIKDTTEVVVGIFRKYISINKREDSYNES